MVPIVDIRAVMDDFGSDLDQIVHKVRVAATFSPPRRMK